MSISGCTCGGDAEAAVLRDAAAILRTVASVVGP